MDQPLIRAEVPTGRGKAGSESETWLARIFILAILGAGLAAHLFGIAPEKLAFLPCPVHSITGVECPGCGMTRACIALAGGDIRQALRYNPFSLGLVLLAGGFALFPSRIRRLWLSLSPGIRACATWNMLAFVLVIWAYRVLI
jgi:hypothetical protein